MLPINLPSVYRRPYKPLEQYDAIRAHRSQATDDNFSKDRGDPRTQLKPIEKRFTKDRRKRQLPISNDRRKQDRRKHGQNQRQQRSDTKLNRTKLNRKGALGSYTNLPIQEEKITYPSTKPPKSWQWGQRYQPGVWVDLEA